MWRDAESARYPGDWLLALAVPRRKLSAAWWGGWWPRRPPESRKGRTFRSRSSARAMLHERLKSHLEAALGFFYPPVCQVCYAESATADQGYVGMGCWKGVRRVTPPFCGRCGLPYEGDISTSFECGNCREMELHFTSARAAAVASGVLRDVIHLYKYHRALWFEGFLSGLLTEAAKPVLSDGRWDLIVPVPLHPFKQREREFNQAERLARCLGRSTGLPVRTDLLRRIEFTPTQTRLTRSARAVNVHAAFAFRGRELLRGSRVVLVDDVLTTGATTSACARVLVESGAEEVCVWTVARGI
jgi:competence protein ComFC